MTPLKSDRLPDFLAQAKQERLFGKIVFEFNDGDVKLVRKELTYKVACSTKEENSNVYATPGRPSRAQ
jgi:hypothetical protein